MAQPDVYARAFEFDPLAPANIPDAGMRLDAEFDEIAEIFAQYRERLALIQRDDGKLANGVVTPDSLSARTRTLIGGGWALRGAWTTATAYLAKDVVSQAGTLYVCMEDHTAGTFSTDLSAGRWLVWYTENVTPASNTITTVMLSSTIQVPVTRVFATAAPGTGTRVVTYDDAGNPLVVDLDALLSAKLDALIPPGTIVAYAGDVAELTDAWLVCDGTNGTPDLRAKFVIGSNDSTFPPNTEGGNSTVTTSASGDHSHGGATGSTTLTLDQIPSHTHAIQILTVGASGAPGGTAVGNGGATSGAAGGGQGHTHSISASGTHTHTATILPPYYSLVYIMRAGVFVIPGDPAPPSTNIADAFFGFAVSDETTPLVVGTEVVTLRLPFAFVSITEVRASLTNPSTSGVVTVNVKVNGTSLFSTNLTIDANETTSTTALVQPVLSPGNHGPLPDDAEVTVDIVAAGTGASGLKMSLIGTRVAPA